MDGRDISQAILKETSNEGPPYELEVRYDGDDNASFADGWTKFAVDHDLHHRWFLLFNYHRGT
jgi:hypothetical protein